MKGCVKQMARKRMVTRTIKQTKVIYLAMNTEDMEAFNDTVILPEVVKDEKKLEKIVREKVNTDTIKLVDIVNVDTIENYYGMTEEKFLENAEVIEKPTPKTAD